MRCDSKGTIYHQLSNKIKLSEVFKTNICLVIVTGADRVIELKQTIDRDRLPYRRQIISVILRKFYEGHGQPILKLKHLR